MVNTPNSVSPALPSSAGMPQAITPKQSVKDEGFQAFGNDGFGFLDLVDAVNPLHHIPIVGQIYRHISGDELSPASRVAGGSLYFGPIGGALSVVNVAVEHGTGKDMGDHVFALLSDDPATETYALANANSNPSNAIDNPENFYLNDDAVSDWARSELAYRQQVAANRGNENLQSAQASLMPQIVTVENLSTPSVIPTQHTSQTPSTGSIGIPDPFLYSPQQIIPETAPVEVASLAPTLPLTLNQPSKPIGNVASPIRMSFIEPSSAEPVDSKPDIQPVNHSNYIPDASAVFSALGIAPPPDNALPTSSSPSVSATPQPDEQAQAEWFSSSIMTALNKYEKNNQTFALKPLSPIDVSR